MGTTETKKMRVGVVGCGAISDIYLTNMIHNFENLEVAACCAGHLEHAKKKAEQYGIKGCTYEEILADPSIEMVVILTPAPTHEGLIRQALEAGKHVYTEKTMTLAPETAAKLIELAEEKHLYLGSAPDTFLGSALQTARKAIDDGLIGEVTSFEACANRDLDLLASMFGFLRMPGGGICYDFGVYYLTALVNLLGPVAAVSAMTGTSFPTRTITSTPHFGETIEVHTPTYITGNLRFASGAIGTLFTTFDVHYPSQARLEVYGSEGTLYVPDPNGFGGPVKLFRPEQGSVMEMPLCYPYPGNSRALGLADMAKALSSRDGKWFRANCRQTFHILEIMEGILTSGKQRREIEIESRFEKMPPMATGLLPGVLD